ncbi:MAG: MBL fold metallo-hydrolase, partial [Clostridia bacterium]|nr:MBL fold metallo-hydrolase [Clostridia bacterium]
MIKNVFLISLLIALLMLSSILLVGCNNVEEPAETQKPTEAAATGAPTQKPTEPETETEEKKMDESKFNVFFDQEYVCAFVISDNATDAETAMIKNFGTALAGYIGKRVTLVKESELEGEYKYYVVFGNTSMQESKDAAALLDEREALAKVVGNKLVVVYQNDSATKGILNLVLEAMKKSKPLYVSLAQNYTEEFKALPDISALPKYPSPTRSEMDCGEGSYMTYVEDATLSAYEAYCAQIEAAEFEMLSYRVENDNVFVCFEGANDYIYTYYSAYNKQIRIIVGPIETLVREDNHSYESEKYTPCISSIAQPKQGEGFIIRLPDGRFIVFDGGYNGEDRVYKALKNLGEGKIVVAAWFISHPHGDHFSAFIDYAKAHGSDKSVTVEQIIVNFSAPERHTINGSAGEDNSGESVKQIYETAGLYMPDVPVRNAHTGQIMNFDSSSVEILYTIEDLMPKELPNGNDASMVIRVNTGGQSILLLADTCYASGPILCNL